MLILPLKANVPKEWITFNNLAITKIVVPSWGTGDKDKYEITMHNDTRGLECECLAYKFRRICHHVRGLLWFCYKSQVKKKGVQPTSAQSYFKFSEDELGKRQKEIFKFLKIQGPLSNREISSRMGIPINSVTPRIKELREMGVVMDDGKTYDTKTDREVLVWVAVGEMPDEGEEK